MTLTELEDCIKKIYWEPFMESEPLIYWLNKAYKDLAIMTIDEWNRIKNDI